MVCHKSQAVDAREWSVYAQRGRFFLMLDSKHQTQSKYLMKGHTAQTIDSIQINKRLHANPCPPS